MKKNKLYIDLNDEVFLVEELNDQVKLKKHGAYIVGNLVLPYMGIDITRSYKKPGLYDTDKGLLILRPLSNKKRAHYSIDRIYDTTTVDDISKLIVDIGVKKNDDIEILLGDTDDVFMPPIIADDNALQVLIKKALINKKIDLKNYISRFDGPSDMNNNKSSIIKHGKMSFEKFLKWCDILDLSVSIQINDKPNSVKPIDEEIEFNRD